MISMDKLTSRLETDAMGEYCLGQLNWASGDFVAALSLGALDKYIPGVYSPDDCQEAFELILAFWQAATGANIEYDSRYGAVFFGPGSRDAIRRFTESGAVDILASCEGNPNWKTILTNAIG